MFTQMTPLPQRFHGFTRRDIRMYTPQERKARLAEEVVIFNVQEAYAFVQPQLANMGSVVGNPMLQRMLADAGTATHVIAEVGDVGGEGAHVLSSITTGSVRPGSLKKKGGDRRGNTPTARFKRPQAKDLEKIKVRVCDCVSCAASVVRFVLSSASVSLPSLMGGRLEGLTPSSLLRSTCL